MFLRLINVTNEVLPYFRQQKNGHIINFSSIGGFVAYTNYGAYAGAKHAVVGISEAYKRELSLLNIRVSVVCPSAFKTRFGQRFFSSLFVFFIFFYEEIL